MARLPLSVPRSIDGLYDYCAPDEVPAARPFMQGDVLRRSETDGTDRIVMLGQHPCSMRSGKNLRRKLSVFAVDKIRSIELEDWAHSFVDYMPLPELLGDKRVLGACFNDVESTPSNGLTKSMRIAALSELGIMYLQQRLVHYSSRFVPDLDDLIAFNRPYLDELELEHDWVEAAVKSEGSTDLSTVDRASLEFQDFLGAADSTLREDLANPVTRIDAKRRINAERDTRYP